MQCLNALHASVNRLHKTSLLEREPIWAANFFIRRTLGERLVAAVVALATGDMMKDNYPVAYLEIMDPFVYGCDDPRSFMSEDAWGGVRAGRDLLQIRTADTAGVDLYEQLPGANFRHGDGFQADVVSTAVYSGLHRHRNRLVSIFHRDLSGHTHDYVFNPATARGSEPTALVCASCVAAASASQSFPDAMML